MGVRNTFNHLQANLFWKRMHKDVLKFVSQCGVCQVTKYETKRPVGLLQPLLVPSASWEDLSSDFITSLPKLSWLYSDSCGSRSVFQGRNSGAFPSHFSAYKVALLLLDMVCNHHGMPLSLGFVSRFWGHLFKLQSL